MVGSARNPHVPRAPLCTVPEIVGGYRDTTPPPSYRIATTQHTQSYEPPRLKCPSCIKATISVTLVLTTYLVWAMATRQARGEHSDFIMGIAQCQKPINDVLMETLYRDEGACPFKHNITTGSLRLNVCKLSGPVVDIRLFHEGLPTGEGILIAPLDFAYIVTTLRDQIFDELRALSTEEG